jgi:hypothetical protein
VLAVVPRWWAGRSAPEGNHEGSARAEAGS